MAEATLNIPQLLLVLLLISLAIRYFYYSKPSTPRSNRADPRHIDQIAQMFPQIPRRDIQWDLQRNGGSVAATTERILSGGRLETPPPSFQPQSPPYSSPPAPSSAPQRPIHPDLITRYNLASRITPSGATDQASSSATEGWLQNKGERQAMLQRRREEMVLKARRRMEDKEKGKERAVGS
ncbi:hypothetical protein MMC12_002432 [Toensbergia leucococca]|nr:hypothetical protein [Toensbergia leucococca]